MIVNLQGRPEKHLQRNLTGMEFTDILQAAFDNKDYRRVVFTGSFCQLTLMSLPPEDYIQDEALENDKIFIVLRGHGEMFFVDDQGEVKEGSCISVPSEAKYRLVNSGEDELKMLAVYAPAEFSENEVQSSLGQTGFTQADAVNF